MIGPKSSVCLGRGIPQAWNANTVGSRRRRADADLQTSCGTSRTLGRGLISRQPDAQQTPPQTSAARFREFEVMQAAKLTSRGGPGCFGHGINHGLDDVQAVPHGASGPVPFRDHQTRRPHQAPPRAASSAAGRPCPRLMRWRKKLGARLYFNAYI